MKFSVRGSSIAFIETRLSGASTTDNNSAFLEVVTPAQDGVYYLESEVIAVQDSGAVGSAGDCATFLVTGVYKRLDGTVYQISSSSTVQHTNVGEISWTATYELDSPPADVALIVTGETDRNITWN